MKDWTIMVYLAGDNNLSENMAHSLESLGKFSSTIQPGKKNPVNLLAYFDSSSLTAPTVYIDYSDSVAKTPATMHAVRNKDIYHSADRDSKKLRGDHSDAPVEQDSASEYTIMNFVRWCIKTQGRTARNYALIFSGHSFGFHGTSFLRDESTGSFMTLFTFRKALEQINKLYLKTENNDRLAILGFDSCVMSMLEVGFELKSVAQTLVASEGSIPNAGWSYASMLTEIVASIPKKEPEKAKLKTGFNSRAPENVGAAARGIVSSFTEQQRALAIGGRSIDISALDLTNIPVLAKKVNNLAKEFNKHFDIPKKSVTANDLNRSHQLKKVILQSHFDSQTYMEEQCVDLKDFCQRLILECKFLERDDNAEIFAEIRKLCSEIVLAVDDTVLKCGYSGDEYQFSNGISLYFPWSYVTYFLTGSKYSYLQFARGDKNYDIGNPKGIGKDWDKFLFNYLTRITLRRSRKDSDDKVSNLNSIKNTGLQSGKSNPPWNKSNAPWNKSNPPWNKSNPPWNKSNPPWNKSNAPWNKSNAPWNKGEMGNYLFHFSRFKNFELKWDISGYSDDSSEENDSG